VFFIIWIFQRATKLIVVGDSCNNCTSYKDHFKIELVTKKKICRLIANCTNVAYNLVFSLNVMPRI